MSKGSQPTDGGNLILSVAEKNDFVENILMKHICLEDIKVTIDILQLSTTTSPGRLRFPRQRIYRSRLRGRINETVSEDGGED